MRTQWVSTVTKPSQHDDATSCTRRTYVTTRRQTRSFQLTRLELQMAFCRENQFVIFSDSLSSRYIARRSNIDEIYSRLVLLKRPILVQHHSARPHLEIVSALSLISNIGTTPRVSSQGLPTGAQPRDPRPPGLSCRRPLLNVQVWLHDWIYDQQDSLCGN